MCKPKYNVAIYYLHCQGGNENVLIRIISSKYLYRKKSSDLRL